MTFESYEQVTFKCPNTNLRLAIYDVTIQGSEQSTEKISSVVMAVPWLRRLVVGLSPRRPGFDPGSVHVGFVVDKVALGQVFPRVHWFSPVTFIPPVLYYKEKRKN
jgi:hypothetical protein